MKRANIACFFRSMSCASCQSGVRSLRPCTLIPLLGHGVSCSNLGFFLIVMDVALMTHRGPLVFGNDTRIFGNRAKSTNQSQQLLYRITEMAKILSQKYSADDQIHNNMTGKTQKKNQTRLTDRHDPLG